MKKTEPLIFLERRTYRVRRLIDAIRLVPILGMLLWTIPIIIRQDVNDPAPISSVMIYIFVIWAILIVASFLLVRWITRTDSSWDSLMSGDETSD